MRCWPHRKRNVWFAGDAGTLVRKEGDRWESFDLGVSHKFFLLGGNDDSLWVGAENSLYHFNGECWEAHSETFLESLVDLWVSPSGVAWALDAIQAYTFTGSAWVPVEDTQAPDDLEWGAIGGVAEDPRLYGNYSATKGRVGEQWVWLRNNAGSDAYNSDVGSEISMKWPLDVASHTDGSEPSVLWEGEDLTEGSRASEAYCWVQLGQVLELPAQGGELTWDLGAAGRALWAPESGTVWSVGDQGHVGTNGELLDFAPASFHGFDTFAGGIAVVQRNPGRPCSYTDRLAVIQEPRIERPENPYNLINGVMVALPDGVMAMGLEEVEDDYDDHAYMMSSFSFFDGAWGQKEYFSTFYEVRGAWSDTTGQVWAWARAAAAGMS